MPRDFFECRCGALNSVRESACTQCGEAQKRRFSFAGKTASQSPGQARDMLNGFLALSVLIFAGVVVVGIIAGLFSNATHEPVTASAHPQRASAARDQHAERESARAYWMKITLGLAIANETIAFAKDSVSRGDTVQANQYLAAGEQYASRVSNMVATDRPDGWDDVGDGLRSSADYLADALRDFNAFMDSNKPSDGASALDASDKAKSIIEATTHTARLKYIAMGGKWDDLPDVGSQQSGVDEIMKSIAGSN